MKSNNGDNLNTAGNSKLTNDPIDSALERNRELWNKSNICSYNLIIEVSHPSFEISGTFDIEAKDGVVANIEIVSRKNRVNLTQPQKDYIADQFKDYLTVQRMFKFIELKNKEKRKYRDSGLPDFIKITVIYNSQYGYPEQITADAARSDSHQTYKIKKFEILNSKDPCN